MAFLGKILDRSAKVLAVEMSGPARQQLLEIFKSLGFANIQCLGKIEDAQSLMEAEEVDWLILPLMLDGEVNAIQTLQIPSLFSEYRQTRISFLLEEAEEIYLDKSFELGLFSWHRKPYTKDELQASIKGLLDTLQKYQGDDVLTSSCYLRAHLLKEKQLDKLLDLEKTLMNRYPGVPDLMFSFAEAQHLNGASEVAKQALRSIASLNAETRKRATDLGTRLFADDFSLAVTGEDEKGMNLLGIGKVVVIDSDDIVRSALVQSLNSHGITDVQEFQDGLSAWEWFETAAERVDAIVTEWKIPKLSTPLLLQRLKSKGLASVPVLLVSSLVKPQDMALLREMGVAHIVGKPVDNEGFLQTFIWLIQQDRMPTEIQSQELKFRSFLSEKKLVEAEEQLVRYLEDSRSTAGQREVLKSELAFAQDNYLAARDFAVQAIKQSGDSIFALNILGKSLMNLRQYEQALKCFQKAQTLSPLNIERLCLIAESGAEIGDMDKAKESLDQAGFLDPSSETVIEGQVKVALADGSPAAARSAMKKLKSMGNVVSYLNNKAVAHAKCGFMEQSVALYRETIEAIPEDRMELQAVVKYNLALGLTKQGLLEDAQQLLTEITTMPASKVSTKAKSLAKKVDHALEKGEMVALKEQVHVEGKSSKTDPAKADGGSSSEFSLKSTVDISAGDLCCFSLFRAKRSLKDEQKKYFDQKPKFQPRNAVERKESFGAENVNRRAG
jgi:DNA-binding response OmpR family regulator